MLIPTEMPWTLMSPSETRCQLGAQVQADHWISERIGDAPPTVRQELHSRGFIFSAPGAKIGGEVVFKAAARLISFVPSLNAAVQRHVDSIFLLEAEEEFDVTHSEPRWPEWIFISRPQQIGELAALRTAENVVHEAMHLQLSLLEQRTPLVADLQTTIRSPWKQEPRHLQGVLHGLYVFVCIAAFFSGLREMQAIGGMGLKHVERRLKDIGDEIGSIAIPDLKNGLTSSGSVFLESLLSHPIEREQTGPPA